MLGNEGLLFVSKKFIKIINTFVLTEFSKKLIVFVIIFI